MARWVVLTPGFESEDETAESEDEDDDYESDKDVPLADLVSLAGLVTSLENVEPEQATKERTYRWWKRRPPVNNNMKFQGKEDLQGFDNLQSPVNFFRSFFDNDMIKCIADQTNLHNKISERVQMTRTGKNFSKSEHFLKIWGRTVWRLSLKKRILSMSR